MSVFTPDELDYLQSHGLGRLATVGPDGRPHIVPLTYHFNVEEDAIDLGGIDFANTKKWRDVQQNQKVTLLVDDASPQGAHAVEVRGDAELHDTGGESINPRFSNFKPEFIRLRPYRIVSWGFGGDRVTPTGRTVG